MLYGSPFMVDFTGVKVAEADRTSECAITAGLDITERQEWRRAWGVSRDRRPDPYGRLLEKTPTQLLPH